MSVRIAGLLEPPKQNDRGCLMRGEAAARVEVLGELAFGVLCELAEVNHTGKLADCEQTSVSVGIGANIVRDAPKMCKGKGA